MPDPGASHAYIRLGRFALIVTTLLWGSSFTIMKDALATVPALWLLAIRFSGAAMLMVLIGIRSLRRLDRGYLTGGACMGVCLYLAYTIQTYGLVHTTPGKNAFLAAPFAAPAPEEIPPDVWLRLGYLCVMCTGLCFLLQTFGQKYTPPTTAALLLTLESVFGTLFSVAFYHEHLELRVIVGFALILVAILISETKLKFLRRRMA